MPMPGFDELQFHEWTFAADGSSARSPTLPPVEFTRQEQAVLLRLIRHPGQLISREQLLDVLDPDYAGVGQRSVDFIVNRLRRKLKDDARNPRFIATRYGEGYVWLVKGRPMTAPTAPVLSIDAIYGLAHLRDPVTGQAVTNALVNELAERLQGRCARNAEGAKFRMELSVMDDATHLHLSLGIRDSKTNLAVNTLTRHFALAEATQSMAEVAAELVDALWSLFMIEQAAEEGPTQQPLYVRAHEAGLLISRSPQYWLELESRILQAKQESPDDPRLRILWAANRHARLLLSFGDDEASTSRLFSEYENIIEAEVLQALPKLEDLPAYQLTAAMLLLTLGHGHEDLAETLIDKAFWNEAPFASVCSLRARLCLCRGELAQSIVWLDRAIEMSQPGSEFQIYLLVLKLKALVAGGNRAALAPIERALYAIKPRAALEMALQVADPDVPLSEPARKTLEGWGLPKVRQLLRHHYFIVVKPMQVRDQRANLMAGPLKQARRIFGDAVVAEEITADLPEL